MMLHTKNQDSRPCGFKKIFSCFPYTSLCKTCDPRDGAIFDPRGIIRTNLVKVHLVMLHTKYQCSRPCGFRLDFFPFFPYISLYKTCDPGAEQFFTLGTLFEQTW